MKTAMQDPRNGDVLPVEVMARKEYWHDGISLWMRRVTVGLGYDAAQPVTFVPQDPMKSAQPMMELTINQAQQLMDELWSCGLRPSEGTGSAGAYAAVQAHLEDMRTLVFKPQA